MAYRKITVDGIDYQYSLGYENLKVRGFPAVSYSILSGIPAVEVERMQHKKTFAVTPSMVADFIRTHTRGETID
jgi:hypothetical protein